MRFGSKKRIEDLVRLLRGQPYASIANGDQKLLVFRWLRLNREFPGPIHVLHCIDAIDHEVHQHLLELYTISHDLRKICRQLRPG